MKKYTPLRWEAIDVDRLDFYSRRDFDKPPSTFFTLLPKMENRVLRIPVNVFFLQQEWQQVTVLHHEQKQATS